MTVATAGLKTRAVLRRIEAGELALCPACGERVKFQARKMNMRVIANVYVGGRWDRVEILHPECYERVGQPYGEAVP